MEVEFGRSRGGRYDPPALDRGFIKGVCSENKVRGQQSCQHADFIFMGSGGA